MEKVWYCPKCKIVPVERKPGKGTTPRCTACKLSNRDVGHYDLNGVRYGTPNRVTLRTCKYCFAEYPKKRYDPVDPVCSKCMDTHRKNKAEQYAEMKKNFPSTRSDYRQFHRTLRKLKKAGLPDNWLELQGNVCGICGTDDPGGKGSWHIDHDHSCCSYDKPGAIVGCSKCIRGILCYHCNTGLGHFRDSPERLREAIKWLEKKPVRLF